MGQSGSHGSGELSEDFGGLVEMPRELFRVDPSRRVQHEEESAGFEIDGSPE